MKTLQASYQIIQCPDGEEALALLESIGRVCHKSEDRMDNGLGEDADGKWGRVRDPSSYRFISRVILKQNKTEDLIEAVRSLMAAGATAEDIVHTCRKSYLEDPPHESVLEHVSITVLFTVDRGVTHELVRHRLAAFTQESTRYCNYKSNGVQVTPPIFRLVLNNAEKEEGALHAVWQKAVESAESSYNELVSMGARPEEARSVLPHSTKADIYVTMNLRSWRHVFRMRASPLAHPQMREVMQPLLQECKSRIPIVFDDL